MWFCPTCVLSVNFESTRRERSLQNVRLHFWSAQVCQQHLVNSVLLPLASSTHFTQKKKMWWFGFGFKRNAHVKKSVEFGLKCGSSSLRTLLNHRVWLRAALQPLRCELVPGLPFFQMLLQCGFMDTWKSGCCVLHVPIFWAFPRLGFPSVTEFLSEFMYVCIYVWLTQYNTVVLHGRNADPPRMELTTALCAKIPIF